MTPSFFTALAGLMTGVWRIFTSIRFPGTNFTFAQLLLFLIFVPLSLAFLKSILGFGGFNGLVDFAFANFRMKKTSSTKSSKSSKSSVSSADPAEILARKYM